MIEANWSDVGERGGTENRRSTKKIVERGCREELKKESVHLLMEKRGVSVKRGTVGEGSPEDLGRAATREAAHTAKTCAK